MTIEQSSEQTGTYETHWICEPPATGTRFTVTDQEWTDDYNTRVIRAWAPA